MKPLCLILALACVPYASASEAVQPTTPMTIQNEMKPASVSLGYILLYVNDVPASLSFCENAFGLSRRFLHESNTYGEMETGATRLGFVALEVATLALNPPPTPASNASAPQAVEIGLVTPDVAAVYAQALKAGAVSLAAPAQKPWGQTVAYVRDPDGHLVELCSPLP